MELVCKSRVAWKLVPAATRSPTNSLYQTAEDDLRFLDSKIWGRSGLLKSQEAKLPLSSPFHLMVTRLLLSLFSLQVREVLLIDGSSLHCPGWCHLSLQGKGEYRIFFQKYHGNNFIAWLVADGHKALGQFHQSMRMLLRCISN